MPGERTLGLDGNVALIGKPFRLAVLIVAIGNLLPLWVPGNPSGSAVVVAA